MIIVQIGDQEYVVHCEACLDTGIINYEKVMHFGGNRLKKMKLSYPCMDCRLNDKNTRHVIN